MTLIPLLALAIVLFVSTNLDDLVVLVGFFADRKIRARDVVIGQYSGMAVLVAVSAAGSILLLTIPKPYLGLLGVFPIFIGIKKIVESRAPDAETKTSTAGGIAGVALVTIANGGDNIGIYVPSFAVHTASQVGFIAFVFGALTALWCVIAHWMVNHARFGTPIRRYARVLVPMVLIGLGISIVLSAGTLKWLLHR